MLKKQLLLSLITFINFVIIAPIYSDVLRKPLIKNGRYYYSEEDTHNHMRGALSFLPRKAIAFFTSIPQKLIAKFLITGQKENGVQLKVPFAQPLQTKPEISSIEPVITWIGHASFLIQIGEFNVLTDPVFSDVYAGPFLVSSRSMQPGIKLEDLPPIDAVVISHNHADHLSKIDLQAIYARYPNVQICVPEGNLALLTTWGFKSENIAEKTWWEEKTLAKNGHTLALTFLPAKHWSMYINPFSYRKSLWGSWMISCNGKNIYFAGDTAYDDHFKQIGEQFENIDIALMPIAPTYKDANEHNPCHVNAKEAIDAFIDLKAQCFIPMHYATFFKGPNSLEHSVNLLFDYWNEKASQEIFMNDLTNKKLLFAQCGKSYTF